MTVWPPCSPRIFSVHHSIVAQIDGLLHACFRVRLERDVCARDSRSSLCSLWGPPPFNSPASTACGLYMPALEDIHMYVQLIHAQRGCGIFIVPHFTDHGPVLDFSGESWLRTLRSFSSSYLQFSFEGSYLISEGSNQTFKPISPWCGYLVCFGYKGQLRRRPKRKEKFFSLSPVLIGSVPLQVGLLPYAPGMVSPLAAPPSKSDDISVRDVPFSLSTVFGQPSVVPVWNLRLLEQYLLSFPYQSTARLARSAMSPEGSDSMFCGDRSKCVRSLNMISSDKDVSVLRSNISEEVNAGRMAGPFSVCPFPNAWCPHQPRLTPLGLVPKHKWDASCDKFRVVSDFSYLGRSSLNNLSYSPLLISFHLQSSHFRDVLACLGPNPQMSGFDIVKAFRNSRSRVSDLHLFLYSLSDTEFYVDLCHSFGHTVSEWSFAAITNILRHAVTCMDFGAGLYFILTYVDNWFVLSTAGDKGHAGRVRKLKMFITSCGVDIHEEQDGPMLQALGWEWFADGFFECPLPKYLTAVSHVKAWCLRVRSKQPLLVSEIESVVGLLYWISASCVCITPLIHVLGILPHTCKRHTCVLDERASYSVFALWDFLSRWNRRASLFQSFSPTCTWQALIRTDASSKYGCGGVLLPGGLGFSHVWSVDERSLALVEVFVSSTFIELLAIEYALSLFGNGIRGMRVQFELDSESGHRDLCRGFSPVPLVLGCVHRIRSLCYTLDIIPRFEHIKRVYNPIADCLANGDVHQARVLTLSREGVRLIVADPVVPLHTADGYQFPHGLVVQEYMQSFRL